jgi:cytochrome bd-type quinol oxidase subunit 2
MAGLWCVVLLIAAATLPVYSGGYVSPTGARSTSATLVDVNGAWALAVVALPLLPVVIVAAVLWRRRHAHRPGAGPVAWTTVCVLWLFAVVTGFSVGPFVLPAVGLLALACAAANRTALPDSVPPVTVVSSSRARSSRRPRGRLRRTACSKRQRPPTTL